MKEYPKKTGVVEFIEAITQVCKDYQVSFNRIERANGSLKVIFRGDITAPRKSSDPDPFNQTSDPDPFNQ